MKKRLFLTGPSGCGKSTVLLEALGEKMALAGGFRTVRHRNPDGKVSDFTLQKPVDDGTARIFLDFSGPDPLRPKVFRQLGVTLLRQAREEPFAVLDEIGGIELLEPAFLVELEELLTGEMPCIGVLKGDSSATMLIEKLGLGAAYRWLYGDLVQTMRSDPDTLIVEMKDRQEDTARELVSRWVEEYAHEA